MAQDIPDVAEFVASSLHHASSAPEVVGGQHALLLALAVEDGKLQSARQLMAVQPLESSVAQGLLAQAQLQSAEISALIHLAVLQDGGETVVGLQIDVRRRGEGAVYRFGAPMGGNEGKPQLRGDLWAMNDAAFAALATAGHAPSA